MGEDDTRREGLKIEAVNPQDGSTCLIQISHQRLQHLRKRGMGAISETAYIVPDILQKPTAVFRGLCWESDQERGRGHGWTCYVGSPERAYDAAGNARKPYLGEVYLVFVNEDGIAYNWRWEKADERDETLPVGYDTRFREQAL